MPKSTLAHDRDVRPETERGHNGPLPIGEILAELLAQYSRRFPEAKITVAETPIAAA